MTATAQVLYHAARSWCVCLLQQDQQGIYRPLC